MANTPLQFPPGSIALHRPAENSASPSKSDHASKKCSVPFAISGLQRPRPQTSWIGRFEIEIESHRDDIAKLSTLREDYQSLREQHTLLQEHLAELLRNANSDRQVLEELTAQVEALILERAAERRRIQRIERILGIDPDL